METFKVVQTSGALNTRISGLEKIILEQLAISSDIDKYNFQTQIALSKVVSRAYSKYGFTTYISLPDNVPVLNTHIKGILHSVFAEHPDMPLGAGFIVHIDNGKLNSIEGYALVGNWPMDEFKVRVLKFTH